jgi:hypothetical protein
MRRFPLVARAVLALASATLPVRAQVPATAELPGAQALVARYIEAIGGRAAVEGLPARWERGRIEMPAQGLVISYELWAARGRQVTRSELQGFGTLWSGVDGEVGWIVNPATGPQLLDGTALQQARQGADPLAALHPERYVAALQTVEETDFGGARCYRVRVTAQWGESYDEFFDKSTGLLAGGIRQQASAQGNVEVTAQITEYRTVAGVRMARVTRARVMGMEMVNTVDTTAVQEIPDSVFVPPPQIRALRAPPPR